MIQTLEEALTPYANKRGIILLPGKDYTKRYTEGFEDGAAWQKEQGINWISVNNNLPPNDKEAPNIICSINVLIWREGLSIVEGFYMPEIGVWRHGSGNWQPTHWAFINVPKTDK